MPQLKISVSTSNTKTHCPSLSFPPGLSCIPGAPCLSEGCYADRMYRRGYHPSIMKAYDRNWDLYQADPISFFSQLEGWFKYNEPRYFRWFVAGDIPDLSFFNLMLSLIEATPETKHLCFTKRSDILKQWHPGFGPYDLPTNLSLFYSVWPDAGVPLVAYGLPWAHISTDPRADGLDTCPGDCVECKHSCWNAPTDIVFKKH